MTPGNVRLGRSGRSPSLRRTGCCARSFNTAVEDGLIRHNPCRIKGAGQEHSEERPVIPLSTLAPGLDRLGFTVESGKRVANRIRRPVLFGANGHAEVSYEIDAFHDGHGVVVEVEAGRGAQNNATYRDIIRASLILDAQFLALLLPVAYRFTSRDQAASVPAYKHCLELLSALYASQRLRLPLDGVLLVGY